MGMEMKCRPAILFRKSQSFEYLIKALDPFWRITTHNILHMILVGTWDSRLRNRALDIEEWYTEDPLTWRSGDRILL